ncbi:MAG: STAS/SEC14 domain-containing protein [Flavipsychrobacter sp.]|nr:STAS/SEC14 domain-containing protein [Flavipsychrobacter sp.]
MLDSIGREIKEITTRTERIKIEDSGIIDCVVLDNAVVSLEDARENIEAVRILSQGGSRPVLVDITRSRGISRDARAYLAGDETARYQSACALVVGSPLSQLIGNFFLGFNRTKFPIKLFHGQDEAREWLHTFL